MKSRKEYIILAGIIVILVSYLLIHKPNQTHFCLPDMPHLSASEITALTLSTQMSTIELKKKDDTWVIEPEKYPADSDRIDPILETIADLTITALSSESKNYSIYDLDEENRIRVQAGAGDSLVRAFDIGKTAPSYRHTFIKLLDDDRVYHADKNFRSKFEKTREQLRDKTVLAVDKSSVYEIRITRKDSPPSVISKKLTPAPVDGQTEQASKEEKPDKPPKEAEPAMTWQDADGRLVARSEVDDLLSAVARLKCDAYIEDKTKKDFTDPILTLDLIGDQTATLLIFNRNGPEDEAYPAVSSQNDYPFLLPKFKAEKILKAFDKKEEKEPEIPTP
jgi:hypothetical protein